MELGVSYFSRARLKHIEYDIKEIKKIGSSFIIHTLSENDILYYRETVRRAVNFSREHKLGIWIDPWGVGGIFGGETASWFTLKNIKSRQISSKGEILPASCINNDHFRDFMKKWLDDAIDLGADVIFWDEPDFFRFEYGNDYNVNWSCRCSACQELFKNAYKKEMPLILDREVKEFRQNSIKNFLEEMCGYVKNKNKNIKNAICFLPFEFPIVSIYDWRDVAGIKHLDIIGTDPYWSILKKNLNEFITKSTAKIKNIANDTGQETQIWIQNFFIKKETEKEIKKAIDIIAKMGIDYISAWSYFGADEMSYLRSDNPSKVWKVLSQCYTKLGKSSL